MRRSVRMRGRERMRREVEESRKGKRVRMRGEVEGKENKAEGANGTFRYHFQCKLLIAKLYHTPLSCTNVTENYHRSPLEASYQPHLFQCARYQPVPLLIMIIRFFNSEEVSFNNSVSPSIATIIHSID